MVYTPISLAARSNQARDAAAGSASLINCYSEQTGQDAKSPSVVYACDGWSAFSTLTSGGATRGMINLDDSLLWVASGGNLYSVTTGGTATNRAAVATSGVAYFARNSAATPDIMMVTSDGLTRSISGTTVSTPSYSVDVGAELFNSVCGHDNYFVFTKSNGEFYLSGINATTIDALDFATAQSDADGLVRGVTRGRDLALFGNRSTEFWQNVGAADFAYQRVTTVRFGAYAAAAIVPVVAVMGGSISDTIIWPATGPDGGFVGVFMLAGYDAQKISTWEIDNAIATATRANLRAYSYPSQGQTFYAITDGATFTYEFNCRAGSWHQRKSASLEFARTGDAVVFNNKTILGDYTTGAVYQLDTSVVPAAESSVSVEVSRDGGDTWTTARTKTIGTAAERKKRTKFNRFGQSKEDGFQLRLKITSAYVEGGTDIDMTIIAPIVHATPFPLQLHTLYIDAIPGVGLTANQKGAIQIGADLTRVQA